MRFHKHLLVVIFLISSLISFSGFSASDYDYQHSRTKQYNTAFDSAELAELQSKSDVHTKLKQDFSNFALSELTALGNELNRSFHTNSIKNYFQNHYASMVTNYTRNMISKKINDAINQFGTGQASIIFDKNWKINQADIDLLVTVMKFKNMVDLFSQIGIQQGYGEQQVSIGFGGRTFSELPSSGEEIFFSNYMLGYNVFFDHDLDSKHTRYSLGTEFGSDLLKASANFYSPISGFRKPKNSKSDYILARPASGLDFNLESHVANNGLFGRISYFQWDGAGYGVDPFRRKNLTLNEVARLDKDIFGLDFSVGWTPMSLFGSSISYKKTNHYNEFQAKLFLTLKTELALNDQLKSINQDSPLKLRDLYTNVVERNKRMVLAYKIDKQTMEMKWVDPDADSGTVLYSPTTSAIPINEKLTRKATITATKFPSGYVVQPITYEFENPNPLGCIIIDRDTAEVTVLKTGVVDINAVYAEDVFYKRSVITYQLVILENNNVALPTCIYQPADPSAPSVNCDPHVPMVDGGFTLFKGIDFTLAAISNSGNTSPMNYALTAPSTSLTLNTDGTGNTLDVTTTDALYNIKQDVDTTNGIGAYTSPDYPLQVIKDKMVLVWDDPVLSTSGQTSINYIPGATPTYTASEAIDQTNIKKPLVLPAVITYSIDNSSPPGIATINSTTGALTISNLGTITVSATFKESEFYLTNDHLKYDLTIDPGSPELQWENTTLPGSTTPVNPAPKLTVNVGDNFTVQASSLSPALIRYSSTNTTVAVISSTTGDLNAVSPGTSIIEATQPAAPPFASATISFTLEVLKENDVSLPTCIFQPADPTAPIDNCKAHDPSIPGGFKLFKGIDYSLVATSSTVNTSPVEFNLPTPSSSLTLTTAGTGHTSYITTTDVLYNVTQAQDITNGISAYISPDYSLQVVKDKMVLEWDNPNLNTTGKDLITHTPTVTQTYKATASEVINKTNIKKPLVNLAVITYAIDNSIPAGIATINSTTGELSITDIGFITVSAIFVESEFYKSNDPIKYTLEVINDLELAWVDIDLPPGIAKSDPNSYVGNPSPELYCPPTIAPFNFTTLATSNSPSKITYSSSDPTIATIDPNTADIKLQQKYGTTTITADQPANPPFSAGQISYDLKVVEYEKMEIRLTPKKSNVWIPSEPLPIKGSLYATFRGTEYNKITFDTSNLEVTLYRSDFPSDVMKMTFSGSVFNYTLPNKGTPGTPSQITGVITFNVWQLTSNTNVTPIEVNYYTLKLEPILSDTNEVMPGIDVSAQIKISPSIIAPNRPTSKVSLEYSIIQKYENTATETILSPARKIDTTQAIYTFTYKPDIEIISPDTSGNINQLYLEAKAEGTTTPERSGPNNVLKAHLEVATNVVTGDKYQVYLDPIDSTLDFDTYMWTNHQSEASQNRQRYKSLTPYFTTKVSCKHQLSSGAEKFCAEGTEITLTEFGSKIDTINQNGYVILTIKNSDLDTHANPLQVYKKNHQAKIQGALSGRVVYHVGVKFDRSSPHSFKREVCNIKNCPQELVDAKIEFIKTTMATAKTGIELPPGKTELRADFAMKQGNVEWLPDDDTPIIDAMNATGRKRIKTNEYFLNNYTYSDGYRQAIFTVDYSTSPGWELLLLKEESNKGTKVVTFNNYSGRILIIIEP